MKIILFDILKNSKKKIRIERYLNTFGECIYVYLNENIIINKNIIDKLNNKFHEKHIQRIFKSKKFDEKKYVYITSYELDKNTILKEKLLSILDDRFCDVGPLDTIKKNSIKYLKSYSNDSKILCIISQKIDTLILLEYIEKFKIVDFLYIGNRDINFIKNINNINHEYGSTVSFINSNDITNYDIYVLFNDVDLSSYIINRKNRFLDLTSSDNDIYSQEYKIYNKYSNEIINKENYSKARVGRLIFTLLTDSV